MCCHRTPSRFAPQVPCKVPGTGFPGNTQPRGNSARRCAAYWPTSSLVVAGVPRVRNLRPPDPRLVCQGSGIRVTEVAPRPCEIKGMWSPAPTWMIGPCRQDCRGHHTHGGDQVGPAAVVAVIHFHPVDTPIRKCFSASMCCVRRGTLAPPHARRGRGVETQLEPALVQPVRKRFDPAWKLCIVRDDLPCASRGVRVLHRVW